MDSNFAVDDRFFWVVGSEACRHKSRASLQEVGFLMTFVTQGCTVDFLLKRLPSGNKG